MQAYQKTLSQLLDEYFSRFSIYQRVLEKAHLSLKLLQLEQPTHIYGVKARIKDVLSLRRKLKLMAREGKLDVTLGLDEQVKDIVGLRVIRYTRSALPVIHKYLVEKYAVHGIGVYFVDDQVCDYLRNKVFSTSEWQRFEDEDDDNYRLVDTRRDEKVGRRGHSAIHYSARLYDEGLQSMPMEIQVKDVFEEAWGELQHDVSYKHPRLSDQQYFLSISQQLGLCSNQMEVLIETIQKKTTEVIEEIAKYIPHAELHPEEVLEVLVDSGVRIDSASLVDRVSFLGSLSDPYKILLQRGSGLSCLGKLLTHEQDDKRLVLQSVKGELIRSLCAELCVAQQEDVENLVNAINTIDNAEYDIEKEEFLNLCSSLDFAETPNEVIEAIAQLVERLWEAGSAAVRQYTPKVLRNLWTRLGSGEKSFWAQTLMEYLRRDDRDLVVAASIISAVRDRDAPFIDEEFDAMKRQLLKPEANSTQEN